MSGRYVSYWNAFLFCFNSPQGIERTMFRIGSFIFFQTFIVDYDNLMLMLCLHWPTPRPTQIMTENGFEVFCGSVHTAQTLTHISIEFCTHFIGLSLRHCQCKTHHDNVFHAPDTKGTATGKYIAASEFTDNKCVQNFASFLNENCFRNLKNPLIHKKHYSYNYKLDIGFDLVSVNHGSSTFNHTLLKNLLFAL